MTALRRASITEIYADRQYDDQHPIPRYSGSDGVVIMTEIYDIVDYTPSITPILFVEWGVRDQTIMHFKQWIHPTEPQILYPNFISSRQPPIMEIHPYKISLDDYFESLDNPNISSIINTKLTLLSETISIPSVIYSPYVDMRVVNTFLKSMGVSIHIDEIETGARSYQLFRKNKMGILITNNLDHISHIDESVPIHLVNLDSTLGITFMQFPHNHQHIHMYMAEIDGHISSEQNEFNLMTYGINDSNRVYTQLINESTPLQQDRYMNLII